MQGWAPAAGPGFGWPLGERSWVNPSPNAANLVDGALLPGHGHARGHDALRGPRHDPPARAASARPTSMPARCSRDDGALAPQWLDGLPAACRAGSSRPSTSTSASSAPACRSTSTTPPTRTTRFRPWRLLALAFKALRAPAPRLRAVARLPLRVRARRLAIDLINGGPQLRQWVDDPAADARRSRRAGGAGRSRLARRARRDHVVSISRSIGSVGTGMWWWRTVRRAGQSWRGGSGRPNGLRRVVVALAAATAIAAWAAQADAQSLMERKLLTGDWNGVRPTLEDYGLKPYVTYTAMLWANLAGGTKRGVEPDGYLDFGLDADLAKLGAWDGLGAHIDFHWWQGDEPTNTLIGGLLAMALERAGRRPRRSASTISTSASRSTTIAGSSRSARSPPTRTSCSRATAACSSTRRSAICRRRT